MTLYLSMAAGSVHNCLCHLYITTCIQLVRTSWRGWRALAEAAAQGLEGSDAGPETKGYQQKVVFPAASQRRHRDATCKRMDDITVLDRENAGVR